MDSVTSYNLKIAASAVPGSQYITSFRLFNLAACMVLGEMTSFSLT